MSAGCSDPGEARGSSVRRPARSASGHARYRRPRRVAGITRDSWTERTSIGYFEPAIAFTGCNCQQRPISDTLTWTSPRRIRPSSCGKPLRAFLNAVGLTQRVISTLNRRSDQQRLPQRVSNCCGRGTLGREPAQLPRRQRATSNRDGSQQRAAAKLGTCGGSAAVARCPAAAAARPRLPRRRAGAASVQLHAAGCN